VNALRLYRDDGPLAGWISGKVAAGRSRRPVPHPLAWLVPPLVRAVEYGSLVTLTAIAEPGALPICFALLGVLAFHHYDAVYRVRHQGSPPPAWVGLAGGGWEGRLLVACGLALAGALELGLLVCAIGLGVVYALESASSWIRFAGVERPAPLGDEGDVVE
jgi:hypothetical protein